MPRLLAIEIENFQSITDTVRIELAPITLLFGPNSAGKSAVFDALELIRDVWSRDQHKQQAIGERLARWRHQRTASSPDFVTARTTLAIEFELESTLPWRCSMPDGHSDRITTIFADPTYLDDESQHWDTLRNLPNTARLSITFDGDAVWNLVLDLGGNRVMSFDHGLQPSERIDEGGFPIVSLHTSHPIFFRTLNDSRDEFELIFRESTAYTDYTSRDERGDLSFSGWLDGKELGDIAWTVADHVTPRSLKFVPVVPHRVRNAMLRVADGTLSHFTHQLLLILNSASALVPADRTVLPAPQTTIYVESDPLMPGEYVVPRAMRPLGSGMPPHFRDLAYAGYAKANARLMSEFGLELTRPPLRVAVDYWAGVFDRVNAYLSEHLFAERLYQVRADVRILYPAHAINSDEVATVSLVAQPALVRIRLQDGAGRTLEIEDVGSGIGFVLPVLAAIAQDGAASIQQPELHLHPALQGRIADVLSERIEENRAKQVILETHSEHLILRLLRRIRDTTRGRGTLKLHCDDVAVYYFDPLLDGGTQVIRQVITPLGDFAKDWPRGFFTDREEDLFDA